MHHANVQLRLASDWHLSKPAGVSELGCREDPRFGEVVEYDWALEPAVGKSRHPGPG
jgi:hypothetical protein